MKYETTIIQNPRKIEAPEPPPYGVMVATSAEDIFKRRATLADLLALSDAEFAEATSGSKWQAIFEEIENG